MSEDDVKERLFKHLCSSTNDLIATSWKGWYLRKSKDDMKAHYFRREFDVAQFREERSAYTQRLILTGYEVKGSNAAFAEGMDQALVLLHQGADFSHLVIPKPDDNTASDLKRLCEWYAPYVGLMFFDEANNLFWSYYHGRQNPHPRRDEEKTRMLACLIGRSICEQLGPVPNWCEIRAR